MTFPKQHWTRLHSTSPIERLNGEIKRRTEVVGIFPNDEAITSLSRASGLIATGDFGRIVFGLKALLTDNAAFVGSVHACTRGSSTRPEARLALKFEPHFWLTTAVHIYHVGANK